MSTSDEAVDDLVKELRDDFENFGDVADMLLALKKERDELRAYNSLRAEDIMTLGALVHDENGVEWKARAEAAEKREAVLRERTLDAIASREAAMKVLNEIANAHAESREDAWRLRKIARAALEAKP